MTAVASARVKRDTITHGVRPVDPRRDLPAIVELIEVGFRDELDPQGWKLLKKMRRVAHQRALARVLPGVVDPTGFVWLEAGQVVGNLSLRHAQPHAHPGRLIGNVVVHPDYRGKGIGRALMETALDTAKEQGARWVGLEVRADNAVAVQLYRHLGFRGVGHLYHLLRPEGLSSPAGLNVGLDVWQRSRPKDAQLWKALVDDLFTYAQGLVLEVQKGLYTFGNFDRWFDLWLTGQRERAWFIEGEQSASMALRVKTDRRHHFHLWEPFIRPPVKPAQVEAIVAKAFEATHKPWTIIAFVADQPALVERLLEEGFTRHRVLEQMILEF